MARETKKGYFLKAKETIGCLEPKQLHTKTHADFRGLAKSTF